jgi:hypothetical protein
VVNIVYDMSEVRGSETLTLQTSCAFYFRQAKQCTNSVQIHFRQGHSHYCSIVTLVIDIITFICFI